MNIQTLKDKLLQSKLFKDSFWAVFGNGIGNALLLLAGIVIARFLGKDLYGEYGVVKSTMLYVASFATFGLGFTSTKYISEQVANGGKYVKAITRDSIFITLVFSGSIALLLLIFAKPLALYVDAPGLTTAFRALAGIIIVKALCTTQIGILSGYKAFKPIAVNTIIAGSFMLVASVPLTYFWGLEGALTCLFLSQIVNTLFNQISIRKQTKQLANQEDKSFKKEITFFSFPVALQESSYTVCNWAAIIILTKWASVGELGLYSAASQWNAIICMVPMFLTNVVLSYLSSSLSNLNEHHNTVRRMLLINLVCTLIPFVIIYILADLIASFYGDSFNNLAALLRILTFATVFESCTSVFKSELMSTGKTWLLFTLRCIRDVTLVWAVYYVITSTGGVNGSLYFSWVSVGISALFFVMMFFTYVSQRKNNK